MILLNYSGEVIGIADMQNKLIDLLVGMLYKLITLISRLIF